MTVETFFANFGHLADAPNGVQGLRELILQLAVQGKLVPQDPNDDPASVLIERVKSEKERLARKGWIKKQKSLPEISEKEKPFSLPESWQFVRLGEITNRIGSGSTPRGGKNAYVQSGIPFLRSQNIWNHGLELQDAAYITPEIHYKMSNTVVLPGDILLNITGASLGRCTVYPDGLGEANVSQHVTIIRPTDERTKYYLHLCILSPYTQALIWGRQVGMAREGLSKKVLELFEIPLPPLEEQKRIVAKVDQLMALCDELEARQQKQQQGRVHLNNAALDSLLTASEPDEFADHWQRICTNFDLLYDQPETIAKLRAGILRLAVQGKLVPQDPNDEPAPVLLDRIRAERARSVKEGGLRKSKSSPATQKSDWVFEIPRGWELCRLADVALTLITGPFGSSLHKSDYVIGGIPVINPASLKNETILPLPNMAVSEQTRERLSGFVMEENDIVMARRGEMGRCALVTEREAGWLCGTGSVILRLSKEVYHPFFVKLIGSDSVRKYLSSSSVGATMSNLNQRILMHMSIHLPPREEQERIVNKVEHLMNTCNELEDKLNQCRKFSEKMMEVTVPKLLEIAH